MVHPLARARCTAHPRHGRPQRAANHRDQAAAEDAVETEVAAERKRLETILRGSAQIGDQGVVTVNVLRSDRIVIDGVRVSPDVNISTNIEFKPLGGSTAWAAPDFATTGTEVMKVVPLMRRLGWFSGCLYNQETSEAPQVYFDHMLKRGDAYALAAEIRQGLDLTRSR